MAKQDVNIDPRVAKQDAKNAVRDPLDALIELITNSMDSYNRIKGRGEKIPDGCDGKIEVYLLKKTRGKERKAIVAVKDWAEGIRPEKMEEYISGYGARTSGKDIFQSIRGYFGRGLKDAAGGLDGFGTLYSIKDNMISVGVIDGTDKNRITYDDVKIHELNEGNLKKFRLNDGCKTFAMVEFSTENLLVPHFDTFAERLSFCVQLRPLMEKGTIKLIQTEKGNIIKEKTLKYNIPRGTQLLLEKDNIIPSESVSYDIEIYKADDPLSQGEEGKFREGGLLIMSGTSVHEATLLKFERDPNASKFFGKIRCDYIDELMSKDEAVVTPDREGLNWDYPFLKKLKTEIEKKLKPFVELEKKEREKHKKGVSKATLERNEALGKKLGKLYKQIMKEEGGLRPLGGEEPSDKKGMPKPPAGFGFIPSYYLMESKKEQKIRLLVESPKIIPSDETIKLESTNKEIIIEKENCVVSDSEYVDEAGIFIHRIGIIGNKSGETGEILAHTRDKRGDERTIKAQIQVKEPEEYPPNGFAFIPNEYRIKVGKVTSCTLKVDSTLLNEAGMKIKVTSNSDYILIENGDFTLSKGRELVDIYVKLRGTKTGEAGIITATDSEDSSRKAEAKVKVISTSKISSPTGFEIEFDDTEPAIQRALCKGNSIYIFVKEPTVKMYFGDGGEYDKALSFRVLCADLITEAFCTKVVDDLVSEDKITSLGEDIQTGIQRKLNQLKKECGPEIHKTYVDKYLLEKEREKLGVV